MTLPTGPAGRLLAMGLLLGIVLAALQLAVVPAWQAYASQGQRLEVARSQLERFQRLAAQLPGLRAQAAQLREQDPLAPYLVQAANDALAAAELQERLKAITLGHAGRILSTRVLKGAADGPFERVVVEARLEISLEGLQDLLYEIDTKKPYLFIEELSVMRRPQRRGNPAGAADVLETRLVLYGLRRRADAAGERRG
ncbi:MAG: type II secretion system protein GspM [Gammaproteobacteria bacterium]|nr:type II secretion system protein GspM [Gammaproteobacteria bacterium]